ncbi:hypothetical protein VTH82DRAFT_3120 [Thermothelomyces myriococcoides]
MSRHALRSALGRVPPPRTSQALALPIRTTTPAFFSTTSASSSESNNKTNDETTNENTVSSSSSSSSRKPRAQFAAVQRLTQLNNSTTTATNNSLRGLDEIPGIQSSPSPRRPGSSPKPGGIDARSLRVFPVATAAPGSGQSGPRVLNLRSLRGGLRGRVAFGRGGAGVAGRSRIGLGAGRGAIGGGAGGGGKARRKDSDKERGRGEGGKLVWKPEEQAVLDRLDKGEVVPHKPELTGESLTGYGAAVATDAPIGPAETILRNMRLMTGGMAFNSDSGVTTDLKEVMKRYFYKKPIFVHSKGEREWIESAYPKLRLVGPNDKIKKALLEPAVLGKYEEPKFADLSDVKGIMANYHSRTATYTAAHSQQFIDKVLSLLPPQQGGTAPSKPTAQPQTKR